MLQVQAKFTPKILARRNMNRKTLLKVLGAPKTPRSLIAALGTTCQQRCLPEKCKALIILFNKLHNIINYDYSLVYVEIYALVIGLVSDNHYMSDH